MILPYSITQSLRLATEDASSQAPAHTDPFVGITRLAVVFALPWPVRSCFPGEFVNGLVCSQGELQCGPLEPWGDPVCTPPSPIHTAAEESVGEEMVKQIRRNGRGRPGAELDQHDR